MSGNDGDQRECKGSSWPPMRGRHRERLTIGVRLALPPRVGPVGDTDWSDWHDAYARPDSGLRERLAAVRAQIERHLDSTAPTPSPAQCGAGDGRDLLGVLATRQDAARVSALLVEYDEGLVARARDMAQGLPADIEVRQADAAQSDVYQHSVPADLVLLCGIFGNVSDADVQATIEASPQLCAPGAEAHRTRHATSPT